MNRRSNRVLTDELTELEEQLVALSLRVAAIRNLNDTATAQAPLRSNAPSQHFIFEDCFCFVLLQGCFSLAPFEI